VKKFEKHFAIASEPGTGEIDALLADPRNMVLYVLEVKDLGGPVTVADIASDLKSFFGGAKSYQPKLAKKVTYARRAKHVILKLPRLRRQSGFGPARRLHMPTIEKGWTRWPESSSLLWCRC
jgi:hypothetical protein